jgi:hypothetical protein
MNMIQLLVAVAKTNKYYYQYIDTLENDNRWSCLPDVTELEIHAFFTFIMQTGHDKWDIFKDYYFNLATSQKHDEMWSIFSYIGISIFFQQYESLIQDSQGLLQTLENIISLWYDQF